jgi:predicted Rossmann fold nucleotide-binding protein DprA/Smf involved in DNA uptake
MVKIVSGGQTGVDRGALDAALKASFPCGGWCPKGRKAEDGPIPDRYPVQELPSADYLKRTRQNVLHSDGTLVISFGKPTGGTAKTVDFYERFGKPVLVVDGSKFSDEDVAAQTVEFIRTNSIEVLNVAGPRESKHLGAAAFAERAMSRVLAVVIDQP